MERVPLFLLCLTAVSCTKQVDREPGSTTGMSIHINEVFAASLLGENHPDANGDWLELYNAGPAMRLGSGEWFLTDNDEDLLKFELSGITLGEQERVRIWCDGRDGEDDGIHASFRLASKGEWLALVHLLNGRPCIIDSVRYAQQGGADRLSASRYPDGAPSWLTTKPTPGGPNEASWNGN